MCRPSSPCRPNVRANQPAYAGVVVFCARYLRQRVYFLSLLRLNLKWTYSKGQQPLPLAYALKMYPSTSV